MMRVVFHYDASPGVRERLSKLVTDELTVDICGEADEERFFELIAAADVLWHVLRPVTANVLSKAPRLKLIQKIGVGVNTIDLGTARKQGIAICNMPGSNSRAVAEMTVLLVLSTLRHLPEFDRHLRTGKAWVPEPAQMDQLGELHGRTVGLVGLGAIPRLLVPILTAMGAKVIYTSRTQKADIDIPYHTLNELLGRAEIVSLHLPLVRETTNIIDATALARMKPGAILINTARGGLVDEVALIAALQSNRLAAAGLDVFAQEPLTKDHPLLGLDNVVLSPHIGWLTMETFNRSLSIAVENCHRLKQGAALLHRVV